MVSRCYLDDPTLQDIDFGIAMNARGSVRPRRRGEVDAGTKVLVDPSCSEADKRATPRGAEDTGRSQLFHAETTETSSDLVTIITAA